MSGWGEAEVAAAAVAGGAGAASQGTAASGASRCRCMLQLLLGRCCNSRFVVCLRGSRVRLLMLNNCLLGNANGDMYAPIGTKTHTSPL